MLQISTIYDIIAVRSGRKQERPWNVTIKIDYMRIKTRTRDVQSQQRQDHNVLSQSSNIETKWIQWTAPLNIQDALSNWWQTHIRGCTEFSWLTCVFRLAYSVSAITTVRPTSDIFIATAEHWTVPVVMERLHKRSAAEELQEFYGTLFHVTSYEHWIKSSLDNAIDIGNVASRSVYGFTTVRNRKRMRVIKNAECVQRAIIRTTEHSSSSYWKIDNSLI